MSVLLTSLSRVAQPNLNPRVITGGANYYDNSFYDGSIGTISNSALTMVADRLYAVPIVLPAGTYDRMGVNYGTAAAAGKLLRVLLYLPNSDWRPGALYLDPGSNLAADGGTGSFVEHTISLVLTQPTVFVGAVWSDGTPSIGGWTVPGRAWYGEASGSSAKQCAVYKDGGTFGTTPNPYGTPTAYITNVVPRIRFRAA